MSPFKKGGLDGPWWNHLDGCRHFVDHRPTRLHLLTMYVLVRTVGPMPCIRPLNNGGAPSDEPSNASGGFCQVQARMRYR